MLFRVFLVIFCSSLLQGCYSTSSMTAEQQARSDRAAFALMSLSGNANTAAFGQQGMMSLSGSN